MNGDESDDLYDLLLTSGTTVAFYSGCAVLTQWHPPRGERCVRRFFLTGAWKNDFDALPDDERRRDGGRRWTVKTRVRALIDQFVMGYSWEQMVRVQVGAGREPLFLRMKDENKDFVEFGTPQTRTFGFFHKHNIFVGCRLLTLDTLKKDRKSVDAVYRSTVEEQRKAWVSSLAPGEVDGDTDVKQLIKLDA